MKRTLSVIITMALLACASSVARADLLSNGSLDTLSVGPQTLPTPTGWGVNAFRTSTGAFSDGASGEGFANVLNPGGNGLFFKPFQGQAVTNTLTVDFYQNNPASAGINYTLTGWAGAGASYIGLTDASVKSQFHLTFLDSSSNILSTATLDLVGAGLGSGAPTPPATGFGYHPYSLTAIAPSGTVAVQAGATMINAYNNPLGGDQAFVVDNFILVPEPSIIALAGLSTLALIFRRRK